jgi:hypothetical protein
VAGKVGRKRVVFLPTLDMQADPGPQSPPEKITFKIFGSVSQSKVGDDNRIESGNSAESYESIEMDNSPEIEDRKI